MLRGILQKKGKPAGVPELAKAALEAGYKTKSRPKVFVNAVYGTLSREKQFEKVGKGLFRAK